MADQVVCARVHLFLQVWLPFWRMELRCYTVGVNIIWRQAIQGQYWAFHLWPLTFVVVLTLNSSAHLPVIELHSHAGCGDCFLFFSATNPLGLYKQTAFVFSMFLCSMDFLHISPLTDCNSLLPTLLTAVDEQCQDTIRRYVVSGEIFSFNSIQTFYLLT